MDREEILMRLERLRELNGAIQTDCYNLAKGKEVDLDMLGELIFKYLNLSYSTYPFKHLGDRVNLQRSLVVKKEVLPQLLDCLKEYRENFKY